MKTPEDATHTGGYYKNRHYKLVGKIIYYWADYGHNWIQSGWCVTVGLPVNWTPIIKETTLVNKLMDAW